VSIIANFRYNPVDRYSQKHTIGYIANTRNQHKNIQCDYGNVVIFFIFNSFVSINPLSESIFLKIHNCTQSCCPLYPKTVTSGSVIMRGYCNSYEVYVSRPNVIRFNFCIISNNSTAEHV
jgi:hypothetical protein